MNIQNIDKIYRHGDVILFKLKETDVRRGERIAELILERGEVTGHAHRLAGTIELLDKNDSLREMLFTVAEQAVLTHEEHDRIVLDPGTYLKMSQVEFDPFKNILRWVQD